MSSSSQFGNKMEKSTVQNWQVLLAFLNIPLQYDKEIPKFQTWHFFRAISNLSLSKHLKTSRFESSHTIVTTENDPRFQKSDLSKPTIHNNPK